MAIWTLTAFNPQTPTIISDGTDGSTLAITITDENQQPVQNTQNITASLVDDKGTTVAGTVTPTTKTSAVGNTNPLRIVTTVNDKLYLKLSKGTDAGTLQLTPTILAAVTITGNPVTLDTAGQAETLTATIKDRAGAGVANLALQWKPASNEDNEFFPDETPIDGGKTTAVMTTYTATLSAITDNQLVTLSGKAINVRLVVGPLDTGMSKTYAVPTSPPLAAPDLALPAFIPRVIDDALISSSEDQGIPFRIPPISNAVKNDTVSLGALTASGKQVLMKNYFMTQEDVQQPLLIQVPVNSAAFSENGPLSVQYAVYSPKTSETRQSQTANMQVQRTLVPKPYGDILPTLTPPTAYPGIYSKSNYDNGDPLISTVNFQGQTKPAAGDKIQLILVLTGYTAANFNWSKTVTLPEYILTASDVLANAVISFPDTDADPANLGITAADLAGVDGSNGDLFFTYQAVGNTVKYRSPGRVVIVDTVQAYSAGYRSGLRVLLARLAQLAR